MFKDMLGRMIWWRIIVVLAVAALFGYTAIDIVLRESVKVTDIMPQMEFNSSKSIEIPVSGEPTSFMALATSSSYPCESGLCIEVETEKGLKPTVFYDKRSGSFMKGEGIYVKGFISGVGVTAEEIFMITTYE